MASGRKTVNVGKYWLTALCFIVGRFAVIAMFLGIVAVAVLKDEALLYLPGIFLAVFLLTYFTRLANSSQVICPLCRTPVFASLGGVQRAKSRKRFGFAIKLLSFRKRPKCIHCREPFRWRS